MTERDDLVAELRKQRLGQLIENVYGHCVPDGDTCYFFVEDVEVMKTLLASKLADKLTGVNHGD